MSTVPLAKFGVSAALFQRMVGLRRDLHREPELSFQEARTAARIAEELTDLGIAFRAGVSGHGIVADLPGRSNGPAVALRADLDALPVVEETGLPYGSRNPGVMHACGHDGHSALLIGAAARLVEQPADLPVRLIWQPAEERGAGARKMVADGVLDGVGMIFGGHLDNRYPVGSLIVTEGTVNASTDLFRMQIFGKQGHGARPHEAIDTIVIGSMIITALQSVVSRQVDPSHPAVVSVGSFHAGAAPNVIAGHAVLEGTLRAWAPEVRDQLAKALSDVSSAVAASHGARIEVALTDGTPPVINTPELTALARAAATAVVGPENVLTLRTANMGGEDFAWFLQHVPGCYIRFGGGIPGAEAHPAHSGRFDFDEGALATASAWMVEVARRAAVLLARS